MNGLALGLGLKRRLSVIRKWAIRIHVHVIEEASVKRAKTINSMTQWDSGLKTKRAC